MILLYFTSRSYLFLLRRCSSFCGGCTYGSFEVKIKNVHTSVSEDWKIVACENNERPHFRLDAPEFIYQNSCGEISEKEFLVFITYLYNLNGYRNEELSI